MSLSSTLPIFVSVGSIITFLGVIYYTNSEAINSGIIRVYQFFAPSPTSTSQEREDNQSDEENKTENNELAINTQPIEAANNTQKMFNTDEVAIVLDTRHNNFIRHFSEITGSKCELFCDLRL